jgi:hypothetical protein
VRHLRITYTPRSDVTPSKVLAAIYRRAIECHQEAKVVEETSNGNKDNAKGLPHKGRQSHPNQDRG